VEKEFKKKLENRPPSEVCENTKDEYTWKYNSERISVISPPAPSALLCLDSSIKIGGFWAKRRWFWCLMELIIATLEQWSEFVSNSSESLKCVK
jgi:hypothetical protein